MLYAVLSYLALVDAPPGIFTQSADSGTLKNIFNVVLALAGAVAVASIVWLGVKLIVSQGEPQEIKKAREGILYALIGLVIVMFAFTILNFVIGKF
jgi:Type IV secretion system pilin